MIADFSIENKVDKLKYFQEIFLIANTRIQIVLKMFFFFKFNNINILFHHKTFM